jgi:hypothetical protein
MESCADHADMPPIFKGGHKYYAQKMGDMLDSGKEPEETPGEEPMGEMDESAKSLVMTTMKDFMGEIKAHVNKQDEYLSKARAS